MRKNLKILLIDDEETIQEVITEFFDNQECQVVSAYDGDEGIKMASQEQYDLVVPDHFLDLDPVQELLASLRRPELRRQVEALEGYDTANMGTPVSGT